MNIQALKSALITLTAFFVLINISSCATLNESECKVANWEIIGLEDGNKGRNSSYIGEHRKACADYNIQPDLNAYRKGHAVGMRQFCSEQNGYQQGLSGQTNNHFCPNDLAAGFQRGHQRGYSVYQMGAQLNHLKGSIDSHIHELEEIADLSVLKEQELINRNTREFRRRELLREIKELERESESIQHEIDEMRVALMRLEEDYQRLLYNQRR